MVAVISYKCVQYKIIGHELSHTLYWWQGLFHYKGEFSGDFSVWTENKNHGDAFTKDMKGKRVLFFSEPQFWYNLGSIFAVGTKVNMYYHVNTSDDVFQVYPTLAIRIKI
jgi:hypothetical protein